jgi:hypothetical protein
MINLAAIANKYHLMFEQRYAKKLQAKHYRALKQIIACHTPAAGAMLYHCDDCHEDKTLLPYYPLAVIVIAQRVNISATVIGY